MVYPHNKKNILISSDSIFIFLSIFIAGYLLDKHIIEYLLLTETAMVILFSYHFFAHLFKLYRRRWEYENVAELFTVIRTITAAIIFTAFVNLIFSHIFLGNFLVAWMLNIVFLGGFRFLLGTLKDKYLKKEATKKNLLIIGAGYAGTLVATHFKNDNNNLLFPVAFVDDDHLKHNLHIVGIPVVGGTEKIKEVVSKYQIEQIIIAIPSIDKNSLNKIMEICHNTNVKTQIVPKIEDLLTGNVSITQLKEIRFEDLLGREEVELDIANISEKIADKVVLVTGAGGSIGSEICRQVAKFEPKQLILLGHGENSIYSIELELNEQYRKKIELITEIADIKDRERIFKLVENYKPDVIYHAAAHKHVPLMERNPDEAVKNNIIGTKNIADAALIFQTETFVMISTDKAVNPESVMGATKRIAEMIIQDLNSHGNTRFAAVRFGNVLGSRGSVIPLFKEQIKRGGPITITHPEMRRYFMTIPEASKLVIQAGAVAQGGEVFVLDMGEPVKIVDLAKNLIRLSGYDKGDIEITYTGIRPGEKLFEELLNESENEAIQVCPKIYICKTNLANFDLDTINTFLKSYEHKDRLTLRDELLRLSNHTETNYLSKTNAVR